MGLMDKVLKIMDLNDSDDYEDDFDEYEEEPKKKRFGKKDIADDEEKTAKPIKNKVMPMRQKKASGMEVRVCKPTSVEDAREITDTLLTDRTVFLNLEGLDVEIAQRIIDFTSGSAYAINGNLKKLSNYIFVITPSSVDISGDFTETLMGAFDVQ